MDVEINLWGVLAAFVASMVIGSVWYSNSLFGKDWRKLVKLDEKRAKKEMPKAMGVMVAMSLLTAYVLAHVAYLSYTFFDYSFLSAALQSAFWMWLGFIFTGAVMMGAFEQRPMKLTAINLGNSLVTFLAMGLAIGLVGL